METVEKSFEPVYRPMGDRGLLVELGSEISPEINRRVRSLLFGVESLGLNGICELLPAYCSLLIVFDPLEIALSTLRTKVAGILESIDRYPLPDPKTVRVPVVYGGSYGPDLDWVAQYHDFSTDDVIGHHTQTVFQVYMLGFTPGFPYMGELPRAIVTPRRETPRTRVPGGSIGIALKQTGIYPVESPGGWQIIGRTPLNLFDPAKSPPTLFDIGDRVEFYPISTGDYRSWKK